MRTLDLCFTSNDMDWVPLGPEPLIDKGAAQGLIAGSLGIGYVVPADSLPSVVHCLPA